MTTGKNLVNPAFNTPEQPLLHPTITAALLPWTKPKISVTPKGALKLGLKVLKASKIASRPPEIDFLKSTLPKASLYLVLFTIFILKTIIF